MIAATEFPKEKGLVSCNLNQVSLGTHGFFKVNNQIAQESCFGVKFLKENMGFKQITNLPKESCFKVRFAKEHMVGLLPQGKPTFQ